MTPRFVSYSTPHAHIEGLFHQASAQRSSTVVLQTHPREWSCLEKWPARAIPDLGVDVFSFNNRYVNSAAGTELVTRWEDFALDVGAAVECVRQEGYEQVVLYGHSAGGPQMAFYQAMAEGGNAVAAARDDLTSFDGFIDDAGREVALPPADGIIFSAATIGTGASFLLRLDASVVDEYTMERDPALDMYNPANGFDPSTGAGRYSPDFLRSYRDGQAARMQRLIDRAQRLITEAAGQDPPVMVIRGTRADPKAVDLALAQVTDDEYLSLPSGEVRRVASTRVLRNREHEANRSLDGMAVHLAESFLGYRAIRPTADYAMAASGISAEGMDFGSVQSSMPTNLDHVSVPVLVLQGTSDANPQLPSVEVNVRAATKSVDKQVIFIEGADHRYFPTEDRFGDTRAVAAGAMATWIDQRFA
ncbi:MAG: hypothetical protein WD942_06355 [Dehalococcoidia bacterium]